MAAQQDTTLTPARCFDRRNLKTPTEQFAAGLCAAIGLRFRGIQPGFVGKNGKAHDAQILADNRFGSTFCVPLSGASTEVLAREYERSNAQWEASASQGAK